MLANTATTRCDPSPPAIPSNSLSDFVTEPATESVTELTTVIVSGADCPCEEDEDDEDDEEMPPLEDIDQ